MRCTSILSREPYVQPNRPCCSSHQAETSQAIEQAGVFERASARSTAGAITEIRVRVALPERAAVISFGGPCIATRSVLSRSSS
jgi:hypothetical protein